MFANGFQIVRGAVANSIVVLWALIRLPRGNWTHRSIPFKIWGLNCAADLLNLKEFSKLCHNKARSLLGLFCHTLLT